MTAFRLGDFFPLFADGTTITVTEQNGAFVLSVIGGGGSITNLISSGQGVPVAPPAAGAGLYFNIGGPQGQSLFNFAGGQWNALA